MTDEKLRGPRTLYYHHNILPNVGRNIANRHCPPKKAAGQNVDVVCTMVNTVCSVCVMRVSATDYNVSGLDKICVIFNPSKER